MDLLKSSRVNLKKKFSLNVYKESGSKTRNKEKSPNKISEYKDFDDDEIIVSQSCIDLSEMLGNIANLQQRGSNLQSSQEFN